MSTAILAPRTRGGLLLRVLVIGLALPMTAALVFVAAVLIPPASPGPGWVRGAAVSVVRQRGVVAVPGAGAFLVETGARRPLAISAHSPQMGETIEYCASSGWFEDPMHGSRFDGLGRYALGPAPHGLDRFDVRVVHGVTWVDPDRVTQGPPRGTPTTPPAGAFCVRA